MEEQLQRAETLARLLASARTALKAGRTPDAARAERSEARVIDPDAPELNDLAAAIRAAIEKEEKALRTREEIRDALGRATKRLAKRDFAGALALVDDARPTARRRSRAARRIYEARQQPVPPGVLERLSTVVGGRGARGREVSSSRRRWGSSFISKSPNPVPSRALASSHRHPRLRRTEAEDGSPPSTAQKDPAGPTPAPEPSREPENPVVRDSRVASAERRAVQQLTAGNPRRAMDYIKEGLGIAPDDPGLRKLRRDIRGTAQRDAEAARRRAVDAGLSTSSRSGPRTRISRRGTAAQKPVARRRRLESIGRRRRVFGAPRPTPCHLEACARTCDAATGAGPGTQAGGSRCPARPLRKFIGRVV